MAKLLGWLDGAMWVGGGHSARARSRRPWRTVEEGRKRRNCATAGVLGLFIGERSPGRGERRLGKVDLVRGDSTVSWRREQVASCMAGRAWRLGSAPRTRVSVGRCQEAGQVALESSPGSTWPRTRRGRGPPAAYGGRRAKQRSRQGRDEGEGLFVISENSGAYR